MFGDDRPGRDEAAWSPIESGEWYAARAAATALRDVLTAAGMQRYFPHLRADVNAFGHGFIELGRISPETAERIAQLIRLALAAESAATDAEPSSHRDTD